MRPRRSPLGDELARCIHRNGWSARALARLVGLDPSRVNHLLTGRRRGMRLPEAERWATAMGLFGAERRRWLDAALVSLLPPEHWRRVAKALALLGTGR